MQYLIVDGFKVPKKLFLELTNVYGLSNLEAMLVILENV